MLSISKETALELVIALTDAVARLNLNNREGEESPFIAHAEAALARLYALPGVRDHIDGRL